MLMYLVKHSRPENLNTVRELTKVLANGATDPHLKAMMRIVNKIRYQEILPKMKDIVLGK